MKIKTATGKIFNYKWAGNAFTGDLVIAIQNSDIMSVIAMGTNREDTAKLTFYPDDTKDDIFVEKIGFTRFSGVLVDENAGTINLTLGREYA